MIRHIATIPSAVPSRVPGQVPSIVPGSAEALAASPLLLDTYPGAVAAWSAARKLRTDYEGASMRVRTSEDNSEADIGFASNKLDESALMAHISGAYDGLVTRLYDQASSEDAEQTTVADQPQIVSAGTILKTGGKPAIKCVDTTDGLDISIAQDVPIYVFAVVDTTSMEGTLKRLLNRTSLAPTVMLGVLGDNVSKPTVYWGNPAAVWGSEVQTKAVIRWRITDDTSVGVQVNGGAEVTGDPDGSTVTTWTGIFNGVSQNPVGALLCELVIYQGAAISDTDSNAIIANMMGFYGIS